MFVVAITGGLGAGKSEAARFYESRGAVVLDLDDVAKALVASDDDVRAALVGAFGEGILLDDVVAPDRLAEVAFSCEATTSTLDAIVHPAVVLEVERRLQDLALQARPPAFVVVEVPLLVEAPAIARAADLIVAIEAPEDVRLARSVERGMDAGDAARRLDRQVSDAARADIADVVLSNEGSLDAFRKSLDSLWHERIERQAGVDSR